MKPGYRLYKYERVEMIDPDDNPIFGTGRTWVKLEKAWLMENDGTHIYTGRSRMVYGKRRVEI